MGGGAVIPPPRLLPEAGGVMDQGAWLMAAFRFLDRAAAKLRADS